MKNKLMSLCLIVAMCFTLLPMQAMAEGSGSITSTAEQQTLDFSNSDTQAGELDEDGYEWDGVSHTLKLKNANLSTTDITFPKCDKLTIELEGTSTVNALNYSGGTTANAVRFKADNTATLTVNQQITTTNMLGDMDIDENVTLIANEGVNKYSNEQLTINGTLKAIGKKSTNQGIPADPAVYCGKLSIGPKGMVDVSGDQGIKIVGMNGNFEGALTINGDGKLHVDCTKWALFIAPEQCNLPSIEKVVEIPDGFLPDGYKIRQIVSNDEYYNDYHAITIAPIESNITFDGIDITGDGLGALTIGAYEFINAPTEWTKGSAEGLIFILNTDKSWFNAIWIDGKEVAQENNYTVEEGSTKITLNPYFLNSLTNETHTLTVLYDGGRKNTDFTVKPAAEPPASEISRYAIKINESTNGVVESNYRYASSGSTVTLTAKPEQGYELNALTVTDRNGKAIKVRPKDDNRYQFTMPSRGVVVDASFKCDGGEYCPSKRFEDIDKSLWYHEAIDDVILHKIMQGISETTFEPNTVTSRAMLVTVLYRTENTPITDATLQFKDVEANAWYTDAIRWAASNDIVKGYDVAHFGPNDDVTREQMAAIIYRYADYKGLDTNARADLNTFGDAATISDWALDAMQWSNAVGIIIGMDNNLLVPLGNSTRAQLASVLHQYLMLYNS